MKHLATSIAFAFAWTVAAQAQEWIEQPVTFWRDPTFQKAFMGSYGMCTELEPRVTVVEKEIMEKVVALMSAEGGQPKAAALLEKSCKPAASAVFDFTLGNLHFQEDRLTNAIACYTAAIQKHPPFQRAHKNLGLIRIRLNEFAAALEPLTRSIELGGADGTTYGLLAYAYAMTDQHLSAESAYRLAMMLQPQVNDWKLGLCRTLFKQQKFHEAIALCDELLLRDPEKTDYLLLQANAWLGLKQPVRAAKIYELLDLTGRTPVAALLTLGDIYVNEGDFGQAADAYGRALARDSQPDLSRHLRNAEVLVSRAAHEEAARLLTVIARQAGTDMPEAPRIRMLKLQARLAAARNEAGPEQARILEEIVRLDPLDGDALILLGQHYAADNMEKAVFYFERAEALESFEADARLRHAQLLVRNGNYQEALPLLKRALELKPREAVQRYAEQVERAARLRNG
jgi:tetratricopeptide (TPR) repeat protein